MQNERQHDLSQMAEAWNEGFLACWASIEPSGVGTALQASIALADNPYKQEATCKTSTSME